MGAHTQIELIEKFVEGRYSVKDYPTLQDQFERWSAHKPLAGLQVVDATPLFTNTLLKYRSLIAAGAELIIGQSPFISADPRVLNFCTNDLGLSVVNSTSIGRADVILDCAASYITCASTYGYVELTRSGIERYREQGVRCYAADSSRVKVLETEYGTGESFFRAMAQLGYQQWKGKRLVVFGSGKVGRGIVRYGKEYGAEIIVVSDPEMRIDGVEMVDYRDRFSVDRAIEDAYCVVMATGVLHALQHTASIDVIMHSCALLANMGAEDEYGDAIPASRTLCNKGTVNFILDEPTHLRFIDATMTLHNHGVEFLVGSSAIVAGIIKPSFEYEEYLLRLTRASGLISL